MESLAEATIETWMADKEEVQLVDMVLRIRAKVSDAVSQNMPIPDIVKERLEKHVATIVKTLPSDLQDVLHRGTILNIDKNYNASSNSESGRNSNERTIEILDGSSNPTRKNDNDFDDSESKERESNTGVSAICISNKSDNETAQIQDHAPN